MPFDFPNSPTVGQIVTGSGSQQWQWDGVKWSALTGTYAGPPPGAIISATPPSYTAGSLWWDTNGAQLYVRYDDGNSVQWVPATNLMQLSDAATQADVARALGNVGRNLVHNPLMNVIQRGGGPWTTHGSYTFDRWKLILAAAGTASVARAAVTDVERGQIGDEAMVYVMLNSFAGSATAGAYNYISQSIEGVRRLAGKTVTVSFYANSAPALKLGINLLQSFGTGGSPSAATWALSTGMSVNIIGATFARYSVTFTVPSASGKTFGTNGDDYSELILWYTSASTTNALAGNIGVQSGTINLWGVQLEIGNVATQLEKPDPRFDLSNCQRFYQTGQVIYNAYQAASTGLFMTLGLPTTMRANPTVVPTNVASGNMTGLSAGPEPGGSAIYVSGVATVAGATQISCSFTASADL